MYFSLHPSFLGLCFNLIKSEMTSENHGIGFLDSLEGTCQGKDSNQDTLLLI